MERVTAGQEQSQQGRGRRQKSAQLCVGPRGTAAVVAAVFVVVDVIFLVITSQTPLTYCTFKDN